MLIHHINDKNIPFEDDWYNFYCLRTTLQRFMDKKINFWGQDLWTTSQAYVVNTAKISGHHSKDLRTTLLTFVDKTFEEKKTNFWGQHHKIFWSNTKKIYGHLKLLRTTLERFVDNITSLCGQHGNDLRKTQQKFMDITALIYGQYC